MEGILRVVRVDTADVWNESRSRLVERSGLPLTLSRAWKPEKGKHGIIDAR